MKKDTTKMLEELKGCSDFKKFYIQNKENVKGVNLSDYLKALIEEKGMKKSEIIRKSEMSEVYAYQILSGVRVPERNKLLCLIFGMGLSLEETQRLLICTGYAELYIKNTFDCIVIYGICKGLGIIGTNEILYEYGQETLG